MVVCAPLADVVRSVIPQRPLYQRLLLPVLGLVLIALGIIGIILPFVPGLPAFLLGLICCSCVHQPSEVWMRGKVSAIKERIFPNKKSDAGSDPKA